MLSQLKLELFLKEIPQVEIARAAQVNRAYVNRIVLGKQKASQKVAQAFKEVAGIDLPKDLISKSIKEEVVNNAR